MLDLISQFIYDAIKFLPNHKKSRLEVEFVKVTKNGDAPLQQPFPHDATYCQSTYSDEMSSTLKRLFRKLPKWTKKPLGLSSGTCIRNNSNTPYNTNSRNPQKRALNGREKVLTYEFGKIFYCIWLLGFLVLGLIKLH